MFGLHIYERGKYMVTLVELLMIDQSKHFNKTSRKCDKVFMVQRSISEGNICLSPNSIDHYPRRSKWE